MSKYSALVKRASNATAALALTLASLTPAVMLGGTAKAAQLTSRSVTLSNSKFSATSVTYTVGFTASQTYDTVVVDICDSPLFDVICAAPAGVDFDTVTAGQQNQKTLGSLSGIIGANTHTITGVTNPSGVGTFYARITTKTGATTKDTGSVALSTTNDLTINARVQEQLSFCVGAVDDADLSGTAGADSDFFNCGDSEFSSAGVVDLGVVSSGGTSTSPVTNTTYSGNEDTGVFMIQTNAIGGAEVNYTSAGRLKIGGECADDLSLVDQCFNSAENYTAWSAEKFGMSLEAPKKGGARTDSGTANLTRDTAYDSEYNWNNSNSVADRIAHTGSTVADWEFAVMTFKARAAATTPTGSYTTSANFVATATF